MSRIQAHKYSHGKRSQTGRKAQDEDIHWQVDEEVVDRESWAGRPLHLVAKLVLLLVEHIYVKNVDSEVRFTRVMVECVGRVRASLEVAATY